MKIINLLILVVIATLIFSCKNSNNSKNDDENMKNNPFLTDYKTDFNLYPFDKIKSEHYLPAIKEGIAKQEATIKTIVDNKEEPNFENVVVALDNSGQLLSEVYYCFENVNTANTNDTLMQISKEIAPLVTKHFDNISLNAELFAKIKAVYNQKDKLNLNKEQLMLLEKHYREFVNGGANLDDSQKERFRKINEELSVLSIVFEENVLAETNSYKLVIDKKEDLSGLSEQAIATASEKAKELGEEGKWVFTLQNASIIPFLQNSDKRELRQQILTAYQNRGNNNNEFDNKENIKKIIGLKTEKAKLLGYKNAAESIIADNMAKTPEKVYDLLNKVWTPALKVAKVEVTELQALIKRDGQSFKLQAWDWWYYSEKLKKEKYDLNDEVLKPYFELNNVVDGLFMVVNKLFGIKMVELKNATKYQTDVKVYEVQNNDGTHVGVVYFDLYARPSKGGGAWMNSFRPQSIQNGVFIAPVISMCTNFAKPTADNPTLLTFEEVQTIYHEFGHTLHGLLSNCTYISTSGTAVARDFVELPSQIMENWTSQPEVLKMYAKHYKTSEVIPQNLIDKLKESSMFNQGFVTVEYVAAALLDMNWHTLTDTTKVDVLKFEKNALDKIGLIPEIVSRYRSTYFRHIFNGEYAAGYYAYMWAEVIEADAFQAFLENGIFDKKTADSFRENVLSKGGTNDAMQLYINFRGAEPNIEPLLKRRGLE